MCAVRLVGTYDVSADGVHIVRNDGTGNNDGKDSSDDMDSTGDTDGKDDKGGADGKGDKHGAGNDIPHIAAVEDIPLPTDSVHYFAYFILLDVCHD